ncbi:hypothetical protein EDWATA_00734 [Edwardsiella tarda ATCC 23685]|uniref:Uncharacterized protein n=1 Tax=Edwardsiella tarda ATCC 23685 TaxID=500638 RepID=D4F1Z0_EDWTA|nr:hypothetical protein EDWATA_00734 [Edwardsiella tarda ATCC 23685]
MRNGGNIPVNAPFFPIHQGNCTATVSLLTITLGQALTRIFCPAC